MTTGSLILDVILIVFVGIPGFVFMLWALITGIFWSVSIAPSGRKIYSWAHQFSPYSSSHDFDKDGVHPRHTSAAHWVDPATYYGGDETD